MNLRKLLLYIHLVVGLAAALLLIVLGGTGAVLVFEGEIDHSLNASVSYVHPEGERMPLKDIVQKVEQAHPGTKLRTFLPAGADNLPDHVQLRPLQPGGQSFSFAVNPYTGEELIPTGAANNFMARVHQLHTNLLMGKTGALIVEWGAILLLVLGTTGLVLWWPRKIFKLRGGAPAGRMNFDLHNALGLYSSVFMFIFGLTGIAVHWENEATQYLNQLAGAHDTPLPKAAIAKAGARLLTPDEAMNAALKAVPGARVTTMMELGTGAPIRVIMKYPEDSTPSGRTSLYLDPTTAQVLYLQTSRTGPLGFRMIKLWNREIHTGDIFGWPSRIVACVASLSLPLLAVTGPLIWWNRWRAKRNVA